MAGEGSRDYGSRSCLLFHGDEGKYELWEVRFLGYLRTVKLHDVVTADNPDPDRNAQVFAELVQLLDDTSLSLVIRDARDKGKEALKILRDHYIGTSKPSIISLYTKFTSLRMMGDEKVTDYLIRAETASASLKAAGETVSDNMLVAMVLKGLPRSEYNTFCTVVTQREDTMSFQELKTALRSCEKIEKCQNLSQKIEDRLICNKCEKQGHKANKCSLKNNRGRGKPGDKPRSWCENCKSYGHDINSCRHKKDAVKSERWCYNCKSSSHDTNFCRRENRDAVKSGRWCENCKSSTHNITNCKDVVKSERWCENCKSSTHNTTNCRQKKDAVKPERWCGNCKSSSHDTNFCRYKKKSFSKINVEDDSDDQWSSLPF